MFEHQATRAEFRSGLSGLEDLLASIASERVPVQRLDALARTSRAALGRPLVPSGEVPEGLRIPSLGEGYVDHRIRGQGGELLGFVERAIFGCGFGWAGLFLLPMLAPVLSSAGAQNGTNARRPYAVKGFCRNATSAFRMP